MPSVWEPLGREVQKRFRTQQPKAVYTTGFPRLDMQLGGGIHEGKYLIIGGGWGGGKSALAESIALAASRDVPVLYVQNDMDKADTEDRFVSKLHKTTAKEFYNSLASDQVRWRAEAENTLRTLNTHDIGILKPLNDREGTIDYIFSEAMEHGAKIIIIDHVRKITGWMPMDKTPSFLGQTRISKAINDLSSLHGIATIALQQLAPNRYDGKKRPTAWMLQDTSALAQDASVVLLPHVPYAEDAKRNRVIEIIVDKNRFGPKGIIHLHWTPHTMSMFHMTREEEENALCCRRSRQAEEELDERFG